MHSVLMFFVLQEFYGDFIAVNPHVFSLNLSGVARVSQKNPYNLLQHRSGHIILLFLLSATLSYLTWLGRDLFTFVLYL